MKPAPFKYPATPTNIPPSVTEPSKAFRKEVGGVMGSIVLFFVTYLVMLILSLLLVVGCFYGGIAIMGGVRHWIGILGGIGLMGLGVMVFIFQIKFIFAVNRYDHSGSIEIFEEEQPELFGFIRQVAKDTQAPLPKRIFISPDVNAAVFYDSSFWSMFLPIRKNLVIGLGLVNSISISEFKAVIAHEFGHFSQRSMKLGSFVYNVNKIIHNMLFDNKGYSGFLGTWANISGVFALFASATVKIAEGIQWILSQMYGFINKNYMRLSREMEFHADAVAASVTGSRSLVTALRRIELANSGYEITLQKCDELFRDKKMSGNIYPNQRTVLKFIADEYHLAEEHGMPVIPDDFMQLNNYSRLNVKDQWASHPTTADREQHLNALNIEAENIRESAWLIFRDQENLQKKLTAKIYEAVEGKQDTILVDADAFEKKYQSDIQEFNFPDLYNDYYDRRLVDIPEDLNKIRTLTVTETPTEIFSKEKSAISQQIRNGESDLLQLKAIQDKTLQANSFDFEGVKYSRKDVDAVIAKLEQELENWKQALKKNDQIAIAYFLQLPALSSESNELLNLYQDYFHYRKKNDSCWQFLNEMFQSLQPLYRGQLELDDVNQIVGKLKTVYEPEFKSQLSKWVEAGAYTDETTRKQAINKFIESDYSYFSGESFFENELNELHQLANENLDRINTWLFKKFKTILELQVSMIRQERMAS